MHGAGGSALFQKHEPGPLQFGAIGRTLIMRSGARCQMIAVVEQMQGLKPGRIKGLGEQHKVKLTGCAVPRAIAPSSPRADRGEAEEKCCE